MGGRDEKDFGKVIGSKGIHVFACTNYILAMYTYTHAYTPQGLALYPLPLSEGRLS